MFHSRTKYIEIDVHFIRDKVLAGDLKIYYVPSEDQIADILTKPLFSPQFNYLRDKFNVFLCPFEFEGGYEDNSLCRSKEKESAYQATSCHYCHIRRSTLAAVTSLTNFTMHTLYFGY